MAPRVEAQVAASDTPGSIKSECNHGPDIDRHKYRGPLAGASLRLRRWWPTLLPARRFGAVRTVFITRRYVFKLTGRWQSQHWRWWWDAVLRGLLSNMQERTFAAEGWPEL